MSLTVLEPEARLKVEPAVTATLKQTLQQKIEAHRPRTTRLVKEFGFEPRSTPEAFGEFIAAQRSGALLGADVVRAAERVILERIRQVRAARAALEAKRD